MLTFVTTSLNRSMKDGFARLEGVFGAKFDMVNLRLDSVEKKVENLDQDVDALTKRFYRDAQD